MSFASRLWERLIGPVLRFAGECLGREYATGGHATVRLPCSGNDETGAQIALGGCATEIPTCCAPRGDWVAGDFKPHHGQENSHGGL
jgi:hypothetical protein